MPGPNRVLIGPLRTLRGRFYLLLVALVAASVVPWVISLRSQDLLTGVARELYSAASLRDRMLEISARIQRADPSEMSRVQALVRAQGRSLRDLLDWVAPDGGRVCELENVCARLRAHLDRWDAELAPLAESALFAESPGDRRRLEAVVFDELEGLDKTVATIADSSERRIQVIVWTGRAATVFIWVVIIFVAGGIWDVFERIRSLRVSAASSSPARVRGHAIGQDEVASLAGALAGAMEEIETRSRADQERLVRLGEQQRLLRCVSEGVNQWIAGRGSLDDVLGSIAKVIDADLAWVEYLHNDGSREILAKGGRAADQISMDSLLAAAESTEGLEPADESMERAPVLLVAAGLKAVVRATLGLGERPIGWLSFALIDARPLQEEDGALLEICGQHLSLAMLARKLMRAESLAAMADLSRTFAHEVRNPLNSLSLQLELLKRSLPAGEPHAASLAAVRGEISRLNELVERTMSLTKGADGGAAHHRELDDLAREMKDLRRHGSGIMQLPLKDDG